MNFCKKIVFIVLLCSSFVSAVASDLVLKKEDLLNAERSEQSIIRANLSPSGIRKLGNQNLPGKIITIDIAGTKTDLNLKVPLKDKIQFGPFSTSEATAIVQMINQ